MLHIGFIWWGELIKILEFMHIGNALKLIRENRQITQDELSLKTGITKSAISALETHKNDPSWAVLVKLSDGLNLKLSSMIRIAELLESRYDPDSEQILNLIFPKVGKG